MVLPAFVNVISFVELMVVVPKSMPLRGARQIQQPPVNALQCHLQAAFHLPDRAGR